MKRLSLEKCQKLIGASSTELTEQELKSIRDVLYTVTDAITDCFFSLGSIDQALLSPPGDAIDCLTEMEQSLKRLHERAVMQ